MELLEVYAGVTVVIRPEEGANIGFVHTADGIVVIDTTSYPEDMQKLLTAAKVHAQDVCLVINTHHHRDHTWGNQLFECPILAHKICKERMQASLENEWRPEAIQAMVENAAHGDPQQAQALRQKTSDLRIVLPNQIFERWFSADLGSVRIEVTHYGAHTPDLAVVWLPEARVLFASDLIFVGRYPYLNDADVPAWVEALNRLSEYNTTIVVPGHGPLCHEGDIAALQTYLEGTWRLVAEHLAKGHSLEETLADPAFPHYVEGQLERYQNNIKVVYQQMERGMRMVL